MDIVTSISTATGLLPFVFLVFVGLLRQAQGADTSRAVIDAFIAWAVTSYLSAEILGFFRSISYFPILIVWILAVGFALQQLRGLRGKIHLNETYPRNIAFLIVGLFATITLFIALTAEPNNWDSQTYRLPRIEHWIQNGSLEHYPTGIRRQNALTPLAELMLLHTRVLTGSDTFYPLIQWISMLCCLFAVFRITLQLGGNKTQSWIAAVFVVTLPMGVLQSTSTQNDYVTAALLSSFVSLGLQVIKDPAPGPTTLLEAVTAGALCGLVKPVGYLIGAGFALWFLIVPVRRVPLTLLARWAAAAAVIFLVIVGPFAARNLSAYGSIQSDVSASTNNGTVGLKQTLDNLILNTAMNLATGNSRIDGFTTRLTLEITSSLGLDAHRADTVFPGQKFSVPSGRSVSHEDTGPNLIHTLLIIAALVLTVIGWRHLGSPPLSLYWCAWLVGIVLFAAVLRWQPWGVRLQLPGFVLAAPLVAVAWPVWRLRAWHTTALLGFLACCGIPALLFNVSRQLVPLPLRPSYLSQQPLQRLFVNHQNYLEPYVEAVNAIVQSKASQIGLLTDGDDWEYPLWRMLRERKPAYPVRIEHIAHRPSVHSWPLGPFIPDTLVWTRRSEPPPRITVEGREFVRYGPAGPIAVYKSTVKPPSDSKIEIPKTSPNGSP